MADSTRARQTLRNRSSSLDWNACERNLSSIAEEFRQTFKPPRPSHEVAGAGARAQFPSPKSPGATQKKGFSDANFPTDSEGRTYHLGTREGEVANRILSVGTFDRAQRLAGFMDPPKAGDLEVFSKTSSRNFSTFSGRFQGVPVSIVSTNMGVANIDFVVRECRAVVQGKMAIARLGTCGIISEEAPLGSLTVAETAVMIRRDPDGWREGSQADKYSISQPIPSDPELLRLIVESAKETLPDGARVCVGKNATACSFYSSQGRTGPHFADFNETLIDEKIRVEHPDTVSLEMESFHLLDLAQVSVGDSLVGCACAIGVAHRPTNAFLDDKRKNEMEVASGEAVLRALVRLDGIADPGPDTIFG